MAIFGFRVKDNLTRSKGQSAVASAAYNAREELKNERTGDRHDYRRNHTEPLLFSGIYTPANAPEWAHDRAQLWNHVERAEGRKDSQLARPIQIDLPHELTNEQRRFLVQDFVRENFTRKGYVVDIAIHGPHRDGDQRNYHAHLLIPLRVMDENGFAKTKKQEQEIYKNRSDYVEKLRENWEHIANRHLERHGHAARIDRRSLEDQGTDREPTQHLGPYATQLERDGEESERGDINRDIEARNKEREEAQREYEAAQAEREQWEEKIAQAAIQKAEEEKKKEAVLLGQEKQRAELLEKQERQKAELEKQQAERKEQREKQAREFEEKAKQEIDGAASSRHYSDKFRLEKHLKENNVGLFGKAAARAKLFIQHKIEDHQSERKKEKLHKAIIENDWRNQDRDEARQARQDKSHERGQAGVEIKQAQRRDELGIQAPERDEALQEALKAAKRTNTEKDFRELAEETTSETISGLPTERAQERLAAWKNDPAKPEDREESALDKTSEAVEKGREAIGEAASEANKGLRVIDKASGIVGGLSNGAASILDGIAKPVEAFAEGIASLFDGGSAAPPIHRREPGPTPDQIREAESALTNINQSIKRGDDIDAADLRNLPKSQLERIREDGDEYLMKMCQNWEIQQREREKERERER